MSQFPQLVPHLLLRTNASRSETAVALRSANYLVSRTADDEAAVDLASCSHVDGVVVELPLFEAIAFVNAVMERGVDVPLLIIGHAPQIIRRAFKHVVALHERDDLVPAVDLMLARFTGYQEIKVS